MEQAVLVFSGFNSRAVIAFCRWANSSSIRYHIVSLGEKDPINLTYYRNYISFTRRNNDLNHKDIRYWITELIKKFGYKKIIILPTTEYLNRYLLQHREAIEQDDCIIPLVNESLYRKLSDKESFTNLCRDYGIDVPLRYEDVPTNLPFVAKPIKYQDENNVQLQPELIINKDDYISFLSKKNSESYFFQEFIDGESLYLLAYIGKGSTHTYSQKNLIQQHNGGSIILAKPSDFHNSVTAKKYINMLHSINFTGLIMIEVRLNTKDNKYYMIEANPRIWGPFQLIIDSNIRLLDAMMEDIGFEINKKGTKAHTKKIYYYWSGGLTKGRETYHSYNRSDFIRNIKSIEKNDIFFRDDTLDLYYMENNNDNNIKQS